MQRSPMASDALPKCLRKTAGTVGMVQPVTFHASPSTVAMMRGFVTTVLKIEGFLPTAPPSAFATTEAKTLTAMVLLIGTQKAMSSARSANPVRSKSCRQMEKPMYVLKRNPHWKTEACVTGLSLIKSHNDAEAPTASNMEATPTDKKSAAEDGVNLLCATDVNNSRLKSKALLSPAKAGST